MSFANISYSKNGFKLFILAPIAAVFDKIPIPQSVSTQQDYTSQFDIHFTKAFQVVPFQWPLAGVILK